MPKQPLAARFITIKRGRAIIECPYCQQQHEHEKFGTGTIEHRAAACRLYFPINRDQRAVGYTFTVPTKPNRGNHA